MASIEVLKPGSDEGHTLWQVLKPGSDDGHSDDGHTL